MQLAIDGNPDIAGFTSLSFARYDSAGGTIDTITDSGTAPNAHLTVLDPARGEVEITPDNALTYWPSSATTGKYRMVMVRNGKTYKWPRLGLGDYSVEVAV